MGKHSPKALLLLSAIACHACLAKLPSPSNPLGFLQGGGAGVPSALNYSGSPYTLTLGVAISVSPSYSGTITSCSSSPALPAGLTLSTTCDISGTPTANQAFSSYTITASNSSGSTTATIAITINSNPPSALNYGGPYTYTVNTTITPLSPTVTGSVSSYSVSPALPTGLAIDSSTGVISGTPTALAATGSYIVTATNPFGSTSFTITLTVNDAPPSSLNYAGNPFTFTNGVTITSVNPTVTGTPTSYSVSPALPTGLAINTTTGQLSGTPSATHIMATYTVTASNTGGSTTYGLVITVVLPAPTNVRAFDGNNQVNIYWTPVAGASSYNIYWATSSGVSTSSNQVLGVSNPYVDSTVSNGTARYYVVTAVDGVGQSSISSEVNAVPSATCSTCRIFVSNSGALPGTDFSTPTQADALCNSNGAKPPGSRLFKAMVVASTRVACTSPNCGLGGSGEHTDWVFYPATTYFAPDGTTVVGTTDANGLLPFPLTNPVGAPSQYWTGMNADWTTNPGGNCANWTDHLSALPGSGVCGDASMTSSGFLNGRPSVTCSQSPTGQQLLCVEQ